MSRRPPPALLDYEAAHRALCQLEVREALKQRTNRAPVQRAIALGARRPHRWSLRAVEHAKLDRRAVGGAAHDTAERVDLAHHGALRDPADGGIAAQLADGVEVRREEECPCSQSSGHDCRFRPGMARSHNYNVVIDAHGPNYTGPGSQTSR